MKFQEVQCGSWFTIPNRNGLVEGPFKKTGNRTYIYRHRLGWYQARIGTINLEVQSATRPDDAPHELADIHVNWHSETKAWTTTVIGFKRRTDEADGEVFENGNNTFYAENPETYAVDGDYKAMMRAIKDVSNFGKALTSSPIKAEKIVIFLNGNEYLIINYGDHKAGVCHPSRRKTSAPC